MSCDIKVFIKVFRAALPMIFFISTTVFAAQVSSGERVVAEGDGFTLTQKQIDDYRSAFGANTGPSDNKALFAAIIRDELFSREYAKKLKETDAMPYLEGTATIEMKVHAAKIYIQQILDDYVLPKDVIESYYLSYPEKFKTGNTPDGKMSVLPLDDNLKNEIKFIIVEKKKNTIIEESVKNLMSKYHIRVINEYQ